MFSSTTVQTALTINTAARLFGVPPSKIPNKLKLSLPNISVIDMKHEDPKVFYSRFLKLPIYLQCFHLRHLKKFLNTLTQV